MEKEKTESVTEETSSVRGNVNNPVSDEKSYDESEEKSTILPAGKYDKLINFLTAVNELTKDKEMKDVFSEEELMSLYINSNSSDLPLKDNVLDDMMSSGDLANELLYSDKELKPRILNINTAGKELKGDVALSKLSNVFGTGGLGQIPLWHSGFWIALRPFDDIERLALEKELFDSEIELGRTTGNLIYSNYSVIYKRILLDFVVERIQKTSLKLEPGKDIRDYIKIQDLYPLLLSLVIVDYPDGYNFLRACSNSLELNKEEDNSKKTKCDFILQAKIDPKKLLWVNKKYLTKEHLAHMSKRKPESVTIDEVIEYQNTVNKTKVIDYTLKTGTSVKLHYRMPDVNTDVTIGEYWVQNIIDKVENIYADVENAEKKNKLIDDIVSKVLLGIYLAFIEKIEFADGSYIVDLATLEANLNHMSRDVELMDKFLVDIKNYINDNTLAVVAIPDYTCPTCEKEQNHNDDSVFSKFIAIDMIQHFFDLSALKTTTN